MAIRRQVSVATKLRLFADASGHCQRPDCLETLFPQELGDDRHIAEMAHVVPHGDRGPRHHARPSGAFDPDDFSNLLLLCPTCHTIVDKDPEAFPRGILLSWKRGHLAALAQRQGVCLLIDRAQVKNLIAAALAENKAIWEELAPSDGAQFEYDPESDNARAWTQRMRSVILPNHYRVQSVIRANLQHATEDEKRIFATYQEHVRGLSDRHVCGSAGAASKFPKEMEGIFS